MVEKCLCQFCWRACEFNVLILLIRFMELSCYVRPTDSGQSEAQIAMIFDWYWLDINYTSKFLINVQSMLRGAVCYQSAIECMQYHIGLCGIGVWLNMNEDC